MIAETERRIVWAVLALLALCQGLAQASKAVVINEFMASNTATLADPDGQFDDWIELYNTSSQPVDMVGMYLTDDLANPAKWQFPEGTTISSHGYLLIWADGDTLSAGLHAGFSLSAGGEELGLVNRDGTLIDSIVFQGQWSDVSYGRWPDGNDAWQYMATPTPGKANKQGVLGVVADVEVSPHRGFYDAPIDVTLTTDTQGAEIWYTVDANVPHQKVTTKGVVSWTGQRYAGAIRVTRTTCIRAVAFKTGWRDSAVTSHSYLFLDDVIRQSSSPTGFPTRWGNKKADYAMDQRVVNDTAYSGEIKDDLKSIPCVCIVVPNADFFGSNGIYANPTATEDTWPLAERAASMEWIDPNTGDHFGVNAGLRIQGGAYARSSSSNPKYGLQFFFRAQYGLSRLEYPLFPDTAVKVFSRIGLREIWNYSWIGDGGNVQSTVYGSDYLRDLFARDTVRDMGGLPPHGRPVSVYINGLYWGLYVMTERIDDDFAADHLGGDKEDYDVLEAPSNKGGGTTMKVLTGDKNTTPPEWSTLFAMAGSGLATAQAYQAIQQYVDGPALIDYMLMIYYTGSRDGPVFLGDQSTPRNFYAIRSSQPAGPFIFVPWDVEWTLEDPGQNRVNVVGVWNPHVLMDRLAANSDFKMLLADHIHRYFHHGGALTRDAVTQRYLALASEIHGAIVGESARWGDVKRSPAFTRVDWQKEVDRLVNTYFSGRTDTVLNQLRTKGWYPSAEAPSFQIDGKDQYGGQTRSGAVLTMVNPNTSGVIYYSLDGSDPRLSQADQQPVPIVTLVPENAPKKVWVPTEDIGTTWRGGNEPFDGSGWTDGEPTIPGRSGGVGYEIETGYDRFISHDVFLAMYDQNASCYIRIPFAIEAKDLAGLRSLTLRVRCDDGFVAFLNGVEVASINRPATLTWNSTCAGRPDSTDLVDIPVSDSLSVLRSGDNVLAVHALNEDAADVDFLFSAELIASTAVTTNPEVSPRAIHYTGPVTLSGSTQVRARVLTTQWSALSEAVYAAGPVAEDLRISELMYHPADSGDAKVPGDPNREFIELTNIGTDTINLALVEFTKGIHFQFPGMDLAPGRYVLVVADVNAFESAYGEGLPIAGRYTGSLSNAGERIQLCDALGGIIEDFTYADNWYKVTDGKGYSLTAVDVKADPSGLASAAYWRPSAHPGGSPGRGGF